MKQNSNDRNETIKLGVISDTHGEVAETRKAVQLFKDHGVSIIVHCGDIGGTEIVKLFQGLETHFVYGNMDGENESLRRTVEEIGAVMHGWSGKLELAGKKIFFLHGHQNNMFEGAIRSGHYDLICYGHTHFPAFQQCQDTLLLNPGAFQRVQTPRVAIVQLPDISVESFAVE